MEKILSAAIQLNAGSDKKLNIENAANLIKKAAHRGAKLIALPEVFNWRGGSKEISGNCESIPGPTSLRMSELAATLKIFLLCGSIIETNPESSRPFNTSFLLNPCGKIIACYRKIHLFKIQQRGKSTIDETRIYSSGNEVVTARIPFSRVGFTICYDLRFPELYRCLTDNGAGIISVPSSFTHETGKAHWEILLRARAIENQVYIIAPNQYGKDPLGNSHYGHSMIVDPWGTVIGQGSTGEKIIYGEIDINYLKKVRKRLPSLQHKRGDVFFLFPLAELGQAEPCPQIPKLKGEGK
jgi:predicted amidohydrolase